MSCIRNRLLGLLLGAAAIGAAMPLARTTPVAHAQATPAPTAVAVGGRIQADNACYVRLPDMPATSLGEGRYGGLGGFNAKTGVMAYVGGADKQTDENTVVFFQMFGIKLDGEKAAWKSVPYSNGLGYTQDTDKGCREGTAVQISDSNWASVFGKDGCDNGKFDTSKKTGGDIKELQILGDANASGIKWVPNSGASELIGDLLDQKGKLVRLFAAWDAQRNRIVFGQGTFNDELDSESQAKVYTAKKVGSQFQLSEIRPAGTAPIKRYGSCAAYVYDKDAGLDGMVVLGGQEGAPERIPATTYKEVWWLDFKKNAANGEWVNITSRFDTMDSFGARREGGCAYDAASKSFYSWMGRTSGTYPDSSRRSTGVWRVNLAQLGDATAKLTWERLAKDNTKGIEGRRLFPSIWDAANKRILVVAGRGGSTELDAFRDAWAIYPDVKGADCENLDVFAPYRPNAGATATTALPTNTPGGPTAEVPTVAPKPTVNNSPEICEAIKSRVPAAVINEAVTAPDKVAGYGQTCNPNLPVGANNPLRRYLGLRNPSSPYHPIFNSIQWKCGCP